MNSGSWAVTCCAFEEAASANAAIEKKSFFIFLKSVPGSWQRFIYYFVNCKVSGKGWNQTESSALIGLRIATPPESSVGPPQLCVYTKSFTAKVPRSWKRCNLLYGASLKIVERMNLRSSWVSTLQLHLNAVVRIDAFASRLQRYEKML